MWSPMRREAIRNARVAPGTLECANCGLRMKENPKDTDKEYAVDHVVPASEPAALIHSWDDFYERLMVPANPGLQVLCDSCHLIKTRAENAVRATRVKKKSKPRRAR
jgi:5-methylcytosine-specific restriction endonuclease McrA